MQEQKSNPIPNFTLFICWAATVVTSGERTVSRLTAHNISCVQTILFGNGAVAQYLVRRTAERLGRGAAGSIPIVGMCQLTAIFLHILARDRAHRKHLCNKTADN